MKFSSKLLLRDLPFKYWGKLLEIKYYYPPNPY